jgi:hypothetical protein
MAWRLRSSETQRDGEGKRPVVTMRAESTKILETKCMNLLWPCPPLAKYFEGP